MSGRAIGATAPLWPALSRLAAWVGGLAGWRALAFAFLAGLVSAAAFPPLSQPWLLIPSFVTLMWQNATTTSGRRAFALGWAFGIGHFLAGLYWVGIAMTVDFERFWWFLPISVMGLSCGLALFIGAATWATWRSRLTGPAGAIAFVFFWLLAEWLRSWLLSGFPWNLLGTAWSEVASMLQASALFGVWGLTLVTLLAAVSLATFGAAERQRGGIALVALAWGMLAATFLFGQWRLSTALETPPGPSVRVVQPSVPQSLKWSAERALSHVERLVRLSNEAGLDETGLVVWPETAVPFNLWQDPGLLRLVATAVPPGGLLVTGAPRYLNDGSAFNALHVVSDEGLVLETYDKVHLVPFGEYVPLSDLLGDLGLAVTRGSFQSGPGLVTIDLPGLPSFSPLICYEVIFPGAVTADDGERPGFLLNLTNDAWFGNSSGPYQHFAMAKLRAVEEGLPLVRSANNGISAVIDPYGRVVGELRLNEIGVLDAALPAALPAPLFARYGNWILLPLLGFLGLLTCAFGQVFRAKV